MVHYKARSVLKPLLGVIAVSAVLFIASSPGGHAAEKVSSYAPVVIKEDFATVMSRMKAEKSKVMARQMELLNKRYDLSNRPAKGLTMTRGKTVQEGVRVKPPSG